MEDNRENIDLADRTSRPIHHGELALMFQRFKIMLDEDEFNEIAGFTPAQDLEMIEEFIIQENFRRDIFPKNKN